MQSQEILVTILLMGLSTLACRLFPFVFLGAVRPSKNWAIWMRYVPMAVLGAAVAPQLLFVGDKFSMASLPLLAAVPVVIVGTLSNNLLASVVVGISTLAVLRQYLN